MSCWRVIVTKSKIMTYCVSQIAGKNMRLKWVYINADSNRSFSANPSNTCRSRLAPWKRISPPEIGDTFFVKLSKWLFSHDLFLLFDFIYGRCFKCEVWYHRNISGLPWSTFKYNRNWVTGDEIGSLYLIYCIVIRILSKIRAIYTHVNIWVVSFSILWSFLWA